MVSFELFQFYYQRRWRWLTISGVILGIYLIMGLAINGPQNIWSYLVAILTQQFVCVVILPTLFTLLVVDLLLADCSERLIVNVICRAKSRGSWLISKISVLFVVAFLFTAVCLVIGFLSGIVLGFPIETDWNYYSLFDDSVTLFPAFTMIFISYIFAFTAFGMLIVAVSVLTWSSVITCSVGAILNFTSYVFWMRASLRPYFKWTPTGQMMFLSKFPNKFTETLFTMQWSYTYTVALFVLSFLVCIACLRSKDLSKSN